MRKLILISAFVLASVATVHAGQSRSLVLAANDTPAAAQAADPAPAPAQAQGQVQNQAQTDAQPQADAPRPRASKPAKKPYARGWDRDEAKARRIAARYGISW